MFRFTHGERSDLYVALLHAFGEASDRLETALSVDDVRSGLRSVGWLDSLDDTEMTRALNQLRDWQLIDAVQNHAGNYRSAAEYERRNLLYSLTRRGEAAFAGMTHAMTVLTSAGALQTAVLDAISDRLSELVEQLERPWSDRRVFTALAELEGHLDALRTSTTAFNSQLQRLLHAEGAELDAFHEVKAATVAYLQEFLTNSEQRTHAIATRVELVEQYGVGVLHERALAGAELPRLPGEDPSPGWLAHRRARWDGLRAWFRPVDAAPPRVEQLHVVARRAIITLLQVLDRIAESRRRASSAAADFRELARWFAVLPEQDQLHRLWGTAFGLGPARHAHLGHPDPELVSPSSSWPEAPPIEVSALLRSAGRTERFSRTGRVRDVRALRFARAERARAERAELDAAWQLLDTGGPVRLSGFGHLDHAVFERLLDLLGRALAAQPVPGGVRRAATTDGLVEVALRPPPDQTIARIWTPRGHFTGPDYVIEIWSEAPHQRRWGAG
jgi:uncharacterized protein (TIGR02677 family)